MGNKLPILRLLFSMRTAAVAAPETLTIGAVLLNADGKAGKHLFGILAAALLAGMLRIPAGVDKKLGDRTAFFTFILEYRHNFSCYIKNNSINNIHLLPIINHFPNL